MFYGLIGNIINTTNLEFDIVLSYFSIFCR